MDNFVVSARKYRPATFVSVVGQPHIASTLKNAISRNQLAHAYLFCGPRGVGKTTCARIFAKAINCLAPIDNEACGGCESCRSFNEGRSFNIHELDAASNNSVDDIRSLTEQVRIPPQIGRYSVYIIDEVHMLSAQAFNAFLKTLEEPPAHAVFILATTEKHKIIPTILSRCQIFDFNRIRVEDSVEYLKYIASQEGVACDDESLHLIALKADGGMRDALSMFDKAVSFCGNSLEFKQVAQTLNVLDYDTYFNVTALIQQGDYAAVLTLFDEVLRKGFSPQSFIGGLNGHFRDLLMSKSPQTLALLEVSGTLLERYKTQSAECPHELLFDAIAVLTALDGTLRTATSQRLNVELGLMKLCGLGQKKKSDLKADTSNKHISPELPPLKRESASKPIISAVHDPQSVKNTESHEPAPKTESVASATADLVQPVKSAETSPQEHIEHKQTTPTQSSTPRNNGATNGDRPTPKSILGSSIGSILSQTKNPYGAQSDAAKDEEPQMAADPQCEQKIAANRDGFFSELHRQRPRIAMAMEEMEVAGNCITLTVPTEQLFEEIMRNRTEILTLLTDVADVTGHIDLKVVVGDDTKVRKPIKAEDKVRFLTEQNPALTLLRKELNLEIE